MSFGAYLVRLMREGKALTLGAGMFAFDDQRSALVVATILVIALLGVLFAAYRSTTFHRGQEEGRRVFHTPSIR